MQHFKRLALLIISIFFLFSCLSSWPINEPIEDSCFIESPDGEFLLLFEARSDREFVGAKSKFESDLENICERLYPDATKVTLIEKYSQAEKDLKMKQRVDYAFCELEGKEYIADNSGSQAYLNVRVEFYQPTTNEGARTICQNLGGKKF